MSPFHRSMPVGAEPVPGGGVHFRVWAPSRSAVEVEFAGGHHPLTAEGSGYFSGHVAAAGPGTRYRFRLDGGDAFPDPASRLQPEGPHGPSAVVDPGAFRWSDGAWRGLRPAGQVLYEMHVGTFTPEGTWAAAARALPELADLGITAVELMPVADFPGRFGWGYDGVNLFAPTRLYGTPDDLRAFVDGAHALGLGVLLDVVYNHLGPDGNYLPAYAPDYFTDRYRTDWGEAVDFGVGPVREYFAANAAYWIREYHLDGLRLDATQNIYDRNPGPAHILPTLARAARTAAGTRGILLIGENEPQEARLVRPEEADGAGLDMLWNDDFHHTARVALTGGGEAYYTDYLGSPQELVSATRWGFLYQGQRYAWQGQRRGAPALDLPAFSFVNYLENHDQVANSARGERLASLAAPGALRALTALLLLGPGTPMLFQGQEFGTTTPFLYFADQPPELAQQIHAGRRAFLRQFPSLATPEAQALVPEPRSPDTFARCRLDPAERRRHAGALALHRDLLRLRRDDAAFRAQRSDWLHGAVLGPAAFILRFLAPGDGQRLLCVNLGRALRVDPAPEPLLAPPAGRRWRTLWSSEDTTYGGSGTPPLDTDDGWWIPGPAAVVLAPTLEEERHG